jgi:hypothetical protein
MNQRRQGLKFLSLDLLLNARDLAEKCPRRLVRRESCTARDRARSCILNPWKIKPPVSSRLQMLITVSQPTYS